MATHPPASAFQTVWVKYRNLPALPPGGGWALVLRDDAADLIAAGDAVDPYKVGTLPVITNKPAPPPVVTVSISAISEADPAVATISAAEMAKLTGKTRVTISGATGVDAGQINTRYPIGAKTANTFEISGLDNSAPLSFAGYPLTGTLT